jgi:CHASE3 domain sensor protein
MNYNEFLYEEIENMSPDEKAIYLRKYIAVSHDLYKETEKMHPNDQIIYLRQKAINAILKPMENMSPDEERAHLDRIVEIINKIKSRNPSRIQRVREGIQKKFSNLLSMGKK